MRKHWNIIALTLGLLLTPVVAAAQTGVTPLLTGPRAVPANQNQIGGYFTLEDDIDLFGVYRRGMGSGFDFGLRAGFSDVGDGALHLGGDLHYEIPSSNMDVGLAFAAGLQFTLADQGNILSVPFGLAIGADVGTGPRTILVWGLPFLDVYRIDPDNAGAETDLEFGVELGSTVEITPRLDFNGALTIASHDDNNVSLALGIVFK